MPDIRERLGPVEPSDPILNLVAELVAAEQILSPTIQNIVEYMLNLAAGKGHDSSDTRQMVGLAAPQIGASLRIVTIDVTADGSKKDQNLEVFINPVIEERSETVVPGREGCWSCSNVCGNVDRAESVTITALDRNGKPFSKKLVGFVARIAQHEVDHLDGIRFPDRIPLDEPERLHWVLPEEFAQYRTEWQTWPVLCPRERWESIKNGMYVQ